MERNGGPAGERASDRRLSLTEFLTIQKPTPFCAMGARSKGTHAVTPGAGFAIPGKWCPVASVAIIVQRPFSQLAAPHRGVFQAGLSGGVPTV